MRAARGGEEALEKQRRQPALTLPPCLQVRAGPWQLAKTWHSAHRVHTAVARTRTGTGHVSDQCWLWAVLDTGTYTTGSSKYCYCLTEVFITKVTVSTSPIHTHTSGSSSTVGSQMLTHNRCLSKVTSTCVAACGCSIKICLVSVGAYESLLHTIGLNKWKHAVGVS